MIQDLLYSKVNNLNILALLEFIYTDEVQLDLSIVYELLALADKYMLVRLKNICEEYLVLIISIFSSKTYP